MPKPDLSRVIDFPIDHQPHRLFLADGEEVDPTIFYKLEPTSAKQVRYNGRFDLRPEIDLKSYTCNSVIDWIEIYFETADEHQPKNIQRRLAKACNKTVHARVWCPLVTTEHQDQGTQFVLRMQEPDARALFRAIDAIRSYPDLLPAEYQPITIEAMELSIDFYPEDQSASARLRMTDVLRRHLLPQDVIWAHKNGFPRVAFDELTPEGVPKLRRNGRPRTKTRPLLDIPEDFPDHSNDVDEATHRANMVRLQTDRRGLARFGPVTGTYYAGAQGDPLMVRINDKVEDKRNLAKGTVHLLTPEQRRSRIEVDVKGPVLNVLGLTFVEDLGNFNFQELRKYVFDFRIPVVDVPAGMGEASTQSALKRSPQIRAFERNGIMGVQAACFSKHRMDGEDHLEKRMLGEQSKAPRNQGVKGYTVGYVELVKVVHSRLGNLTRKWRRDVAREIDRRGWSVSEEKADDE
ncbi:hypothetical protein ACW9UR_23655 [Halovulum sp. GXIMD14794]